MHPKPRHEFKYNFNSFAHSRNEYYEFNRTLEEQGEGKISVGPFYSWHKQHHLYVGIRLSQPIVTNAKNTMKKIARAW